MKLKIIFVLFTITTSLFFYSCSNEPSKEKVIATIKTQLEQKFPSSWSEGLLNGKNAKVDSIKIIQFGNFNDNGQYWPVKAKVWGTYVVDYLVKSETKTFNKVGDFKLYKDDYGIWQASLKLDK